MEKRDLSIRVLNWAKENGKHFCIHDIMPYFNKNTQESLAGVLHKAVLRGNLIKSYDINSCGKQEKRHHTFAFDQKSGEDWLMNRDKLKAARISKALKKAWKNKNKMKIKPDIKAVHNNAMLAKAEWLASCPYCGKKVLIVDG